MQKAHPKLSKNAKEPPAIDGPGGFAARLKQCRLSLGLTQLALAQRCGVAQQLLSRLELGKEDATPKIVKIARGLGVTAEWLETGKGQRQIVEIDLETLPLARLMEAMAARLAKADPTLRRTAANLVTRYVEHPEETQEIAQVMKRLLDPEDYAMWETIERALPRGHPAP
jgi:transcriptional regulator with XRE-family HTH domain